MLPWTEKLHSLPPEAIAIISMAFMLSGGFLMTRVTKKLRLPNVTAYIISGILMGPFVLNLVPPGIVSSTGFLPDIALAFIAFSTGEFFRIDALKKNGIKVVLITIFESFFAAIFVFILSFFILRLQLPFAVVLSALATATAPASTIMTIRQTGARGDFVETLLQVVALDDVVGLVLYSIAISIAVMSLSGESFHAAGVLIPIGKNILLMGLGAVFGVMLKLFITHRRSDDNRLIIAIALLMGYCGICTGISVSPLLGCMMMSMVYINISDDDRLFKQLNYFTPPILLLFFVRSGISFDLEALVKPSGSIGSVPLLVIGILYFLIRIAGKYAGAFLGCLFTGKDRKVRDYLGLALIPQAGVAIGLAAMGARTIGGSMGRALETIILSSSVLYELVGPGAAKLSLFLSGSYSNKLEKMVEVENTDEAGNQKTSVQLLIEQIQKIQDELPSRESEDEEAFTEAAQEQYDSIYRRNNTFRNRRFFKL